MNVERAKPPKPSAPTFANELFCPLIRAFPCVVADQLFEPIDAFGVLECREVADGFVADERLEHAPHDLPASGLRHVLSEDDLVGAPSRADHLIDGRHQFFPDFLRGLDSPA